MQPRNSSYKLFEKTAPPGDNKLIHEQKTPFQLIRLFQNGHHYWMSLNGEMQFHTAECYTSHKKMCVRPLQLLGRPAKNVLVIGGGDGLPAQELLKHIPRFTQVELDRKLIELTKLHPVMRKISNDAFNSPRVNLLAGDGLQYLISSNQKYDIIIDDCDFSISNQPGTGRPGTDQSSKYDRYKGCMVSKLTPGGIAVYMEPVLWPWRFEREARKGGSRAPSWLSNIPSQWKAGSPAERKRLIKKSVRDDIEDWKEYTPYVHSELVELPFIGPEHYLYMSNRPIGKRV